MTDDGRRTPSHDKSSHCLWKGELKRKMTGYIKKEDCATFISIPYSGVLHYGLGFLNDISVWKKLYFWLIGGVIHFVIVALLSTISTIVIIIYETGTTYPSRTHGFTSGFFGGTRVAHLFSFLCCVFVLFFLHRG